MTPTPTVSTDSLDAMRNTLIADFRLIWEELRPGIDALREAKETQTEGVLSLIFAVDNQWEPALISRMAREFAHALARVDVVQDRPIAIVGFQVQMLPDTFPVRHEVAVSWRKWTEETPHFAIRQS